MQVYNTPLASIPTISLSLRSSINNNLAEIVELHEEILGDLHRVVPHSEYTQGNYDDNETDFMGQGHHRRRKTDVAPAASDDPEYLQRTPGMTAEARVAADVARVFGHKVRSNNALFAD